MTRNDECLKFALDYSCCLPARVYDLFIDSIREDTEIDNIDYVVDMMDALAKLRSTLEVLKLEDNRKTECPYTDLINHPKEKV